MILANISNCCFSFWGLFYVFMFFLTMCVKKSGSYYFLVLLKTTVFFFLRLTASTVLLHDTQRFAEASARLTPLSASLKSDSFLSFRHPTWENDKSLQRPAEKMINMSSSELLSK